MRRAAAIAAAVLAAGVVFAEKGPKLRQTDPLQPFWFNFRRAVLGDKYAEIKSLTQFPFETLTTDGQPERRYNKRQFDILFPSLTAVAVGKRSMLEVLDATENLPAEQWDDAADGQFQLGTFLFKKVKGQWLFVQAYTGPAAKSHVSRSSRDSPTTESGGPTSYDHSVLTSPSAPSILSKPAVRSAPPPEEPEEVEVSPAPEPPPKKARARKPPPPPPEEIPEPAVEAPVTPVERPAPSEDTGGTTSPNAKSVLPRPGKVAPTTVKTIKTPPPPKGEPLGGIEPELPDTPAEDITHFRGFWYAFRGAVLAGDDAKIKSLTKFSFETKGDSDAAKLKKHNAQEFDLLWGRLLQADPQTGPLRDSMREFIFRRADLTVEELAGEKQGQVRVGLFIFKKVKGKWAFTRALVDD